MKRINFIVLLIVISSSLQAQCFPDSLVYFEKGSFNSIEHSQLYFDIRKNLNSNNFKKCAQLSDSLFRKHPETDFGKNYASICYDQVGETEKAIAFLIEGFKRGNCVFQKPRKETFMWSESLRQHKEFIKLCNNYNGGYHTPPASRPELRDSLIEILIWTMDSPEKNQFKYLNSEHYFKTVPNWENNVFGKNLERKFDRLVSKYGLPTANRVGERMTLIVAMSIIIHSPNVDFMKKYEQYIQEEFAHSTLALLRDKINVFEKVPQKYGTQIFYSSKQNKKVFYPIEAPDDVNQLRLKMGLDPLENYASMNGVDIEAKYNQEYNK